MARYCRRCGSGVVCGGRKNRAVSGVLCSFVGLLLTVTGRFAQNVAWDRPQAVLAIAAFIALQLKVDILWVILVGTGVAEVLRH